jgi:tetratricopeptide (TPR) repeat protein
VTLAALLIALQATAAPEPPPSYDALVSRAVAEARTGDRAGAEALLARARALDPARPEALVELAGLRFLDARYADAVALLRPAVRAGADSHARDLLATSLYLEGRPDEAIDAWNALRRPVLRNVRIEGMHDTRARLVVPQLTMVEGALLTRDQLRETRLRLFETGAFDRAAVRAVPLGTGESDVEIVLAERRGLGSPPELAALTISKALQRTAYLRYENLDGTGIGARASYRWESTQPRAEVALRWPRPLGLGATLLAEGGWGRADYALEGSLFTREDRGAELGVRRVLAPRTVGQVKWQGRRRTFDGDTAAVPSAQPGFVSGLSAQAEHRLSEGWRHRLDATASLFGAAAALGSDLGFAVGQVKLHQVVMLSAPERVTVERSVLAAQLIWGRGSTNTPLDAMFVPGAASEMELPLRAYRDRQDGVLGQTPIGRSLWLVNLEWRRRLVRRGPVQAGAVLFFDAARVAETASGDPGTHFLPCLGGGLRVGLLGVLVRADYAVSLSSPSSHAFTAGLGQAF